MILSHGPYGGMGIEGIPFLGGIALLSDWDADWHHEFFGGQGSSARCVALQEQREALPYFRSALALLEPLEVDSRFFGARDFSEIKTTGWKQHCTQVSSIYSIPTIYNNI